MKLLRQPLVLASALAALWLPSCAVSSFDPETGEVRTSAPSSSLVAQGHKQFELMKREKRVSTNAGYKAQVDRVAARLTPVISLPNAHWEFVVFEDPTPNAFALPGGKVGVHSGLFKVTRTEAGLAAVIGHEIAHVVLNHSQQRVNQAAGVLLGTVLLDSILASKGVQGSDRAAAASGVAAAGTLGVILPYSRSAELDADKLGALYMARAGYDPREAVDLWGRFAEWRVSQEKGEAPEFLRTHPLDQTRIDSLREFMPVALREYSGGGR